jgi:hypothetical protein
MLGGMRDYEAGQQPMQVRSLVGSLAITTALAMQIQGASWNLASDWTNNVLPSAGIKGVWSYGVGSVAHAAAFTPFGRWYPNSAYDGPYGNDDFAAGVPGYFVAGCDQYSVPAVYKNNSGVTRWYAWGLTFDILVGSVMGIGSMINSDAAAVFRWTSPVTAKVNLSGTYWKVGFGHSSRAAVVGLRRNNDAAFLTADATGEGSANATAFSFTKIGVTVGDTIDFFTYTPAGKTHVQAGMDLTITELPPPIVNLRMAVSPSFSNLDPGTHYQLQVSCDLNTWTNEGAAFSATNTSMKFPKYWDVEDRNRLFFRLQGAP